MTENKRGIGSDLSKVDAYENTAADYVDTPELDDAFFARAELLRNGRPMRGRPTVGEFPKKQVTLRLDQEIIDHYRASGPGWQTRINEVLRSGMGRTHGTARLATQKNATRSLPPTKTG